MQTKEVKKIATLLEVPVSCRVRQYLPESQLTCRHQQPPFCSDTTPGILSVYKNTSSTTPHPHCSPPACRPLHPLAHRPFPYLPHFPLRADLARLACSQEPDKPSNAQRAPSPSRLNAQSAVTTIPPIRWPTRHWTWGADIDSAGCAGTSIWSTRSKGRERVPRFSAWPRAVGGSSSRMYWMRWSAVTFRKSELWLPDPERVLHVARADHTGIRTS